MAIVYQDYLEHKNGKQIQKYWDDYFVEKDFENGTLGMPGRIEWSETIFDERIEAKKYLDGRKTKYVAVKYRTPEEFNVTKQINNYEKSLENKKQHLETYIENSWKVCETVKIFKCQKCESMLNAKYLKRMICPVCHHDIRHHRKREHIKTVIAEISEIEERIAKCKKKVSAGKHYMWLLKIDLGDLPYDSERIFEAVV